MTKMRKTSLAAALIGTVTFLAGTIPAQSVPPQYPPPAAQGFPSQDINVQFLGEMLRSASSFHDVVKGMQLDRTFDQGARDPGLPPAEKRRRELARTAAIMGAGAGAGVAIGSMSHSEKGLLIGALVGTAGGLVIDQIMRHREAKLRPADGPPPQDLRERHYPELQDRDRRDSDNDNDRLDRDR